MQEELITFETAKLAKEKGFNILTISYYTPEGYCTESAGYQTERLEESNWNDGQGSYPTSPEEVDCSAPTQALLQKWLREVHNIDVFINRDGMFRKESYCIFIHDNIKNISRLRPLDNDMFSGYSTYEEALEVGLQEALKLIEIIKNS